MRKLRKSEVNRIIKENSTLSDEGLLHKYSDLVFRDVLGSRADRMEEAGWDKSDIRERREYEEYMDCYTDILGWLLQERGIDPWKGYTNNTTEDNNDAEIH